MEAQRLLQEIALQVIENFQELAWERIGQVVKEDREAVGGRAPG